MKVSFVIPMYEHFSLTNQILMDIYTYSSSVDEVLLLDNGSRENLTRSGLDMWLKSGVLPLRVIGVEKNIGFLRICNWGVPQAEHENIVLISNDVRIESDLAEEIRRRLSDNVILGGVLYRGSTGWNEFDNQIYPYLEGWLLAFKERAWEDIGGFDDDYAPNDFEDMDFSTAALNMGYSLVPLDGKYTHLAAQTIGYNSERLAITERNRERFREKWVS